MEKNTVLYTERVEHEAEEVAKSIKIAEYEWKVCHMSANITRSHLVWHLPGGNSLPIISQVNLRQPEVKDLIAYLKVLYNLEDNVAMYRKQLWIGLRCLRAMSRRSSITQKIRYFNF